MMNTKKMSVPTAGTPTIIVLVVTIVCWGICGAYADVWTSVEPYDSLIPGLDYYDGSPSGYGYPCEIYAMALSDNENSADGKFSFEIQTNFGDLAERQAFDNAHKYWRWMDSYTTSSPYLRMQNFAVGDLYIRVGDIGGTSDAIYGLVLEGRQGTSDDPSYTSMNNAGYTSYDAKTKDELYLWTEDQLGFATGTYEEYSGEFDEVPDMEIARQLPGLADTTDARLNNAYPTLMLEGDLVSTSGNWADWRNTKASSGTEYLGVWEGEFNLPSFDPNTQYVEVWWSMQCGNDGVRVLGLTAGFDPVPAPSGLALLGIGSLCSVVWVRLRRKK
ncbi:MAG: PEP-CTERM sorting domain-containing protein [Planctomycetes bacterium]|nr:PEP-CTERM sorting domain-containing protein [Planctomycetota bacterium]